jgi:pyruvate,orthophosphate dikinase
MGGKIRSLTSKVEGESKAGRFCFLQQTQTSKQRGTSQHQQQSTMQRFLTEAGRLGKSMWHHGPRLESKISGKEEHPAPASTKMIYLFKEGNKNQRELLGGKGANLCEMTNLNMPVPPGFVISTEVCAAYFADKCLPAGFEEEMAVALSAVEMQMGQKFGDVSNPLLLSVRSGAPVSMPGMMDTVLNLGLNDEIVEHLATSSGNERWAFDCYRRFLQMYSDIVLRVDGGSFEKELTSLKEERGALTDADLTVPDLKELVRRFKLLSPNVPTAPMDQLTGAICAVFSSWFNQRAVRYRNYHGITGVKGTAVNIQAMVFGNKNTDSATGVAFSRDPSTGARHFFGEFLEMAEGEDVVAGIRTPQPIDMLKERWPALYQQLWDIQDTLEKHYADMQDIEFTIQDGELFMLQCRSGKRTAKAAVKIAVDMHDEGMLTKAEALRRIPAEKLDFFLHPSIDPTLAAKKSAARGLPASPGAATGAVVFTPDEAHEAATMGLDVILVRRETTPEDIHGMRAAVGILTQYGECCA